MEFGNGRMNSFLTHLEVSLIVLLLQRHSINKTRMSTNQLNSSLNVLELQRVLVQGTSLSHSLTSSKTRLTSLISQPGLRIAFRVYSPDSLIEKVLSRCQASALDEALAD